MAARPQRRYPLADLFAAARLPEDAPAALAEQIGVTARTVVRWRTEGGVPERAADAAAVALGLVPSLVWPDYDRTAGEAA